MKKSFLSLNLILLTGFLSLQSKQVGSYYDIDSIEEYNKIALNHRPSVIYYYTPSCGACQSVSPAFEQASQELQHSCDFMKIDLDKDALKPIGAKHKIEAVPRTIIKDSSGKNIDTIIGSESAESYKQNIKTSLNKKTGAIATQPTRQAAPKQYVKPAPAKRNLQSRPTARQRVQRKNNLAF